MYMSAEDKIFSICIVAVSYIFYLYTIKENYLTTKRYVSRFPFHSRSNRHDHDHIYAHATYASTDVKDRFLNFSSLWENRWDIVGYFANS
jgi:hypothetical protein